MYNGIGLKTVRGSGTNGYVQRNLSLLRRHKEKVDYKSEEELLKLDAQLNKGPNLEILDHERKRKIELKCIEMQELMEEQGYKEDEIQKKVSVFRNMLVENSESGGSGIEKDDFGRPIAKATHQMAEVSQMRNETLKAAFGIAELYKEGSSFLKEQKERKTKEEAAKTLAMAQAKYSFVQHQNSESEEEAEKKEPSDKKKKKKRKPSESSSSSSSSDSSSDDDDSDEDEDDDSSSDDEPKKNSKRVSEKDLSSKPGKNNSPSAADTRKLPSSRGHQAETRRGNRSRHSPAREVDPVVNASPDRTQRNGKKYKDMSPEIVEKEDRRKHRHRNTSPQENDRDVRRNKRQRKISPDDLERHSKRKDKYMQVPVEELERDYRREDTDREVSQRRRERDIRRKIRHASPDQLERDNRRKNRHASPDQLEGDNRRKNRHASPDQLERDNRRQGKYREPSSTERSARYEEVSPKRSRREDREEVSPKRSRREDRKRDEKHSRR